MIKEANFLVLAIGLLASLAAAQPEGRRMVTRRVQPLAGIVSDIKVSHLSQNSSDYIAGIDVYDGKKDESRFLVTDSGGRELFARSASRLEGHISRSGDRVTFIKFFREAGKEAQSHFEMEVTDTRGNSLLTQPLQVSKTDVEGYPRVANYGELVADRVSRVIYSDGRTVDRPSDWRHVVGPFFGWQLLPNADLLVQSSKATARVNLKGQVIWLSTGVAIAGGPDLNTVDEMPRYLIKKSSSLNRLTLVDAATGVDYWNVYSVDTRFALLTVKMSRSGRLLAMVDVSKKPKEKLLVFDVILKKAVIEKVFERERIRAVDFDHDDDSLLIQLEDDLQVKGKPLKFQMIGPDGSAEWEAESDSSTPVKVVSLAQRRIIRSSGEARDSKGKNSLVIEDVQKE